MSGGFDWEALARLGLGARAFGGLGLDPERFWRLTPFELRLMAGAPAESETIGAAGLAALMALFPDDAQVTR